MGTAFDYQGHLSVNGNAANGLYDFRFALFDEPAAGTQQGSTLSLPGLTVTDGSFTVTLDFGSVFDGNGRWLAIAVGTNGAASLTDLTPRQSVMPTPYALYAMTPAGPQGPPGLNWRGTFNDSATYAAGDAVAYEGSSYLATNTINGTEPFPASPFWQLLALAGDTGPAGPPGATGNTGPQGPPGPAGTVANDSITSAQLAKDSASLGKITGNNVIQTSNGNVGIGTSAPGTLLQISGSSYSTTSSDGLFNVGPDSFHGASYLTFDGASVQARNSPSSSQPFYINWDGGDVDIGDGTLHAMYRGNVGIGTENPASTLDVHGTVTATAFVGNGAGLTGLAAATVANNSITDAQLANDSSSLGKITGTSLNQTTAGIGVFTTAPYWPLAVQGQPSGTMFSWRNGPTYTQDLGRLGDSSGGYMWLYNSSGNIAAAIQAGGASYFTGGNVGIGKANPGSALDVNGTVTATAFVGNGAGLTGLPAPTIANNSITSAQLASDPASLGKMTGGMSSDSNGDTFLNNHNLFLRNDDNHGVGWFGAGKTFAGASPDGPVLFGYSGGALGTERYGTETIALSWTTNGAVGIGKTSPLSALDVNGTVTATAFVGNGAGLTGLPAPTIANNSITDAQLANDSSSLGKITGTSLNQTTAGIGVFTTAPYWPLAVQGQPSGTMFSWRNGPTYTQDLGRLGDSSGGFMWLYNSSGNIAAAIQAGGASYFTGGNVGIGKANPGSALDVNGTVTATAFVGNGAGLTGLPAPTIANNSITDAQLASDPASLGKVTAGNVTLDSNGDVWPNAIFLNSSHDLYLRNDLNHGLGWYGAGKTFAGTSVDGPVLFGYSGGALGTEQGGTEKISLSWTPSGAVGIGKTTPATALDVNGTVTATAFVGNGAGLTGLPAPTVANNSITDAQLASDSASLGKITGGKMIETSGGNVGLGTSTPGTLLQVAGSSFVNASHDGLVNIGPDGTHGSTYLTFDGASIQARSSPSSGQPCYLNWNGGDVDIGDYTLHAYYNGGVAVGTTVSPGSYKLYVGGNAYCTGAWSGSDARWKKNVQPVAHALDKVTHLQGVTYDWRRDEFPDRNFDEGTQLGFLAQEVEKVVPEAVHTDAEGYKAVAYEKLTAVLTEGVKEQQTEIESLKARNAALENDVTELKALVNKLLAK
jgi:hypothetical protein